MIVIWGTRNAGKVDHREGQHGALEGSLTNLPKAR